MGGGENKMQNSGGKGVEIIKTNSLEARKPNPSLIKAHIPIRLPEKLKWLFIIDVENTA